MRQWNSLVLQSDAAAAVPVAGLTPGLAPPAGTVTGWNRVALQAIARARPGPPAAARLCADLHACMYNAWAAYDDDARQTAAGMAVRLPRAQRHAASKAGAMHHAAYGLLRAHCPAQAALFARQMQSLGLDPAAAAAQFSPAGIGRTQAAAMLDADRAGACADLRAAAALARWFGLAAHVSIRDRHDDDHDVLLFFVVSQALAEGGTAAAAEAMRRFTGSDRLGAATFTLALAPGEDGAAGRQAGARAFERARRCWMGRL